MEDKISPKITKIQELKKNNRLLSIDDKSFNIEQIEQIVKPS